MAGMGGIENRLTIRTEMIVAILIQAIHRPRTSAGSPENVG
jgi:hypothetical protein